jgi:hypothetical protein
VLTDRILDSFRGGPVALLLIPGVFVVFLLLVILVYSRQHRGDPHDIEGTRKSAAHRPDTQPFL